MKPVFKKKERRKPVSISLSDSEKKAIEGAAKKVGLSMSDYIRQCTMQCTQA